MLFVFEVVQLFRFVKRVPENGRCLKRFLEGVRFDLTQYQQETVSVRGREEALGVRVISDASQLDVPERSTHRTRQRESAA